MSVLRGGASYASQGRISVAGHRAEPNEHGRSMCRGRYSACSGYNCRWWAAVALGGPVSINQPALNTRPRPLAREIARLAGRSQLPRMRFACTIYVSRRIAGSVRGPALAREASKYRFFSGSPLNESSVLRVRWFFVRHGRCAISAKLVKTIYFIRTDETSFFSNCHHLSIRFVVVLYNNETRT